MSSFLLQEEEMRRLVAAQRDLHQGGETSQSDWSEEEEEEVLCRVKPSVVEP
jgi:hypothetical protein